MSHTFQCQVCSLELTVSDKLFAERIVGNSVSVRCKRCKSTLTFVKEGNQIRNLNVAKHAQASPASVSVDPLREPCSNLPNQDSEAEKRPVPVGRPPLARNPLNPVTKPTVGTTQAVTVPTAREATRAKGIQVPRPAQASKLQQRPVGGKPHRPPVQRANPKQLDVIEEVSDAMLLSSDPPPCATTGEVSVSTLLVSDAPSHTATDDVSPAEPSILASSHPALVSDPNQPSETPNTDLVDAEPELTPPAAVLALGTLPPSQQRASNSEGPPSGTSYRDAVRSTAQRRRAFLGAAVVTLAATVLLGFGFVRWRTPRQPASEIDMPVIATRSIHAKSSTASPVVPVPEIPSTLAARSPTIETGTSPSEASSPLQRANGSVVATDSGAIPDYVSKPAVIQLTGFAIRRAERCHPKGHAVGTARVYFTFATSGRISEARIEGEPLASAPVARCILDYARAIQMRAFDGPPFTVSLPITLR